VAFFQAIRAALTKSTPGNGTKSAAQRELAIQQLVSRAVVSTVMWNRAILLSPPDQSATPVVHAEMYRPNSPTETEAASSFAFAARAAYGFISKPTTLKPWR